MFLYACYFFNLQKEKQRLLKLRSDFAMYELNMFINVFVYGTVDSLS